MKKNHLVWIESLESRRLLSVGAVDPYFGTSGQTTLYNDFSSDDQLLVTHDGKIISVRAGDGVLDGQHFYPTLAITRFNSDGSPDVFNVANIPGIPSLILERSGRALPAALDANDRLFVENNGRIYCILPNGKFDLSFGDHGRVNSPFTYRLDNIFVQRDGNILISGEQRAAGIISSGICRITPIGKRDTTFGPKGVRYLSQVNDDEMTGFTYTIKYVQQDSQDRIIAEVDNDAILIDTIRADDHFTHTLMRLNADGSVDDSFAAVNNVTQFKHERHVTFGIENEVTSDVSIGTVQMAGFQLDRNDRAVVLLSDINPDDPAEDQIMRLRADGTLDPTFGGDGNVESFLSGAHSRIDTMTVLPSGKVVVAAEVDSDKVNNTPTQDHYLVQLNEDGTPDVTFGSGGVVALGKFRQTKLLFSAMDGTLLDADNTRTDVPTPPRTFVLHRYWESNAPAATLSFRNITSTTTRPQSLDVTYRDDGSLDLTTLGNRDVKVQADNGFTGYGKFIGVISSSNNDGLVTARYRLTAPGGNWDSSDNGLYTVRLLANQISDTDGNTADGRTLGFFLVRIRNGAMPSSLHGMSLTNSFAGGVLPSIDIDDLFVA